MKRIIFILIYVIISLFPNINYAQKDSTVIKKVKLSNAYLDMGIGEPIFNGTIKNSFMFGIGGNFISTNNLGVSVSYNYYNIKAKEMPDHYVPGLFGFVPADGLQTVSVRLVNEFPTSTKNVRYGVEGGLSMVRYDRAHFTYADNGGFNFGSNYTTCYTTSHSVGLSFRAKTEFLLSKSCGLEIATISNINKFQSYIGLELHFTLGLVRNRI